ncbi:MAG: cation diffusion facilitator family transporter [Myxococcota bacterium]|nr:cation diffusion facilitator family transporter [Myxococcota bacterium]
MNAGSRRAVLTAFGANLAIAIAKFVAWSVTGAASMLAEGVHSLADTSNQGLLLLGSARAKREATPEHPFGYGRERYFWAFVVSVVLFTLGSLFAIYEGVHKLSDPHPLESPQWAIGVLVAAIAFESYAFRTAVKEANHVRTGTWMQFVRRAKSPELPVILLEDLGALVGLLLALIGIGLALLTGDSRFDALGSLSIGILLGVIAVVLAVEMKSLLLGESVTPQQQEAIVAAVEGTPEVTRLLDVRTQHLGPEEILVAGKIELARGLDVPGVAEAIDAVEARIRAAIPGDVSIYLEPDMYRPERDSSLAAARAAEEAGEA